MRSTSALYRCACEEGGCVLNVELVRLFHCIDVALQSPAPLNDEDEVEEEGQAKFRTIKVAAPSLIAVRPSLLYPTHITLSDTYLGDAGTAAFFRVLPMMRWLRTVRARGVGAGSRSIDALCGGLTAYLVEGCEEAPPLHLTEDEEDRSDQLSHPLAGRLPGLELVDLRDNDAIFTLSVEKLLAVLRKRRAALIQWCAKHGECDPDAAVLPALEVLVNLSSLLPTTAQSLQVWNDAAVGIKQRRQAAAEQRRWAEQLRVFTVLHDVAGDSSSTASPGVRPTGEQVVFRLPLLAGREGHEEGGNGETSADVADASSVHTTDALRESINTHMRAFLAASCMLAPLSDVTHDSPLVAAATGARAALQACVDFGADTLDMLPYSNAAFWYLSRVELQHDLPPNAPVPYHSLQDVQRDVQRREARQNIGALLRVLESCPALEQELLASPAAGGVVVERHLRRLRELYGGLQNSAAGSPQSESDFREMVGLYDRVVAACVTPRFSEQHLPSMAAYEQHVDQIVQHVLRRLVVGTQDVEQLAATMNHLRQLMHERAAVPDKSPPSGDANAFPSKSSEERDDIREANRLLPPIMAACYYHVQGHPELEEAWKQTYAGISTTATVVEGAKVPCLTSLTLPEVVRAFHTCGCTAAASAASSGPPVLGVAASGCPVPCTACAFRALSSTRDALRVAEEVGRGHDGDLLQRWRTLTAVRSALPKELRVFFLDMVVRQRSRLHGGCAYVPPLDELSSIGEEVVEERWSMTAWLACSHNQRWYWVELLRAFAQWYRLRALEFYKLPEAQQLLHLATA
jgi:hypothetical protein